jgi:hypothetical protein
MVKPKASRPDPRLRLRPFAAHGGCRVHRRDLDGEQDQACLVGHVHAPIFINPELMGMLVQQGTYPSSRLNASLLRSL